MNTILGRYDSAVCLCLPLSATYGKLQYARRSMARRKKRHHSPQDVRMKTDHVRMKTDRWLGVCGRIYKTQYFFRRFILPCFSIPPLPGSRKEVGKIPYSKYMYSGVSRFSFFFSCFRDLCTEYLIHFSVGFVRTVMFSLELTPKIQSVVTRQAPIPRGKINKPDPT